MNCELKKEKDYIEIDFTHTSEETEKAFLKEYVLVAKDLKLNGFRPGKVPVSIAKNIVKKDEIKNKVFNKLIKEEIELLEIEDEIYANPEIKIIDYDKDLKSIAKMYLYPKIKLNDDYLQNLKKLKLEKVNESINEEEIQNEINNFLKSNVDYIESNEVKDGYLLIIDIQAIDLKTEELIIEEKDYEMKIGDENVDKLFETEIIKCEKDVEKEFSINYPEDYVFKKLSNKHLKYKINIKQIYELKVPELNDDLIKNNFDIEMTGDIDYKAILIAKLEEKILEERKEEIDKKNYEIIMDDLILKSTFDLSDYILNIEKNKLFKNFLNKNELDENISINDFAKMIDKSDEETINDFNEITRNKIYSYLILNEINKKEKIFKIEKEETDFEKILEEMNENNFMNLFENMNDFLQNDKDDFSLSKENIKKTMEFLINKIDQE